MKGQSVTVTGPKPPARLRGLRHSVSSRFELPLKRFKGFGFRAKAVVPSGGQYRGVTCMARTHSVGHAYHMVL